MTRQEWCIVQRNAVAFAKEVDGEMIVVAAIGGKGIPILYLNKSFGLQKKSGMQFQKVAQHLGK